MKKSAFILLLLLSISAFAFAQDVPKAAQDLSKQDTTNPAALKKLESEPQPNADSKPVALTFAPLADSKKFTLIAYGDTRFSDPKETAATNPEVRVALVKQIASEKPSAVLISGDLPWHGGDENDWNQYEVETKPWRDAGIHVYPALGNHELNGGDEKGINFWWAHFPELKGSRWYSVRIGNCLVLSLDSNSKLGDGSPQTDWIKTQLSAAPKDIDFVLFTMHHPAYTDSFPTPAGGHSARKQEQDFAAMLEKIQPTVRARFLVVAGHVNNYERFEHNGVVYLTSGGGGAKPYPIDRSADALYKYEKVNYHYIRLSVDGRTLSAHMFRWEDDGKAGKFVARDSFTLNASSK